MSTLHLPQSHLPGREAEGVTPKRARRGQEPAAGARPSRREPAAEASSSHRGPAAADEEFVDVLVEDEPEPVPMTPPPRWQGVAPGEDGASGTGAGS